MGDWPPPSLSNGPPWSPDFFFSLPEDIDVFFLGGLESATYNSTAQTGQCGLIGPNPPMGARKDWRRKCLVLFTPPPHSRQKQLPTCGHYRFDSTLLYIPVILVPDGPSLVASFVRWTDHRDGPTLCVRSEQLQAGRTIKSCAVPRGFVVSHEATLGV